MEGVIEPEEVVEEVDLYAICQVEGIGSGVEVLDISKREFSVSLKETMLFRNVDGCLDWNSLRRKASGEEG